MSCELWDELRERGRVKSDFLEKIWLVQKFIAKLCTCFENNS